MYLNRNVGNNFLWIMCRNMKNDLYCFITPVMLVGDEILSKSTASIARVCHAHLILNSASAAEKSGYAPKLSHISTGVRLHIHVFWFPLVSPTLDHRHS